MLESDKRDVKTKAELKKDSNKMVTKFFKVCKSLRHFILTNSVNNEDLKWVLQHYISCETIKETDCHRSITSDDIENEHDIAKLMGYITSFSSFFNFKLVEEVIDVVGYEEGKQMIEQYKKDFTNYLKKRVVECPRGIGRNRDDQVHFLVQLDNSFKDCRMSHLITLRDDICEILQIEKHCLLLDRVEPGSVWVVFNLFKLLVQYIFPFKNNQIVNLSKLYYLKAKILKIRCEGYSYGIWKLNDGKFITLSHFCPLGQKHCQLP